MDIYSDSEDRVLLEDFINEKKNPVVKFFRIEHCASFEQDKANDELINDWLNDKI